ncbi:MAG: hypothetical protein QM680_13280 [Luteolibacter sp.]
MKFHRLASILSLGLSLAAPVRAGETVVMNEENPQSLPVLTQIEKPFVFIYGEWPGKVWIEDGSAKLITPNGKGAAGANENMSAEPGQHPILRITISKENKARCLSLVLRDASGYSARWNYDLTVLTPEIPTFLRPIGNLPLGQPHSIDKINGSPGTLPDLQKLTQWKLCGDRTDDALDAEVSVILLADD